MSDGNPRIGSTLESLLRQDRGYAKVRADAVRAARARERKRARNTGDGAEASGDDNSCSVRDRGPLPDRPDTCGQDARDPGQSAPPARRRPDIPPPKRRGYIRFAN